MRFVLRFTKKLHVIEEPVLKDSAVGFTILDIGEYGRRQNYLAIIHYVRYLDFSASKELEKY